MIHLNTSFTQSTLKKLPALLVALAIWLLSAQSTLPLPDLGLTFTDKIAHLIAYAVLLVVLVTALYGLLDEFHQPFVPGRDCSFFDWLADCAGAVIGVILFARIRKSIHGGAPPA